MRGSWPTTSLGLVTGLQQPQDGSDWERFSAEYAPALIEFCQRRGLQTCDAEDIVQTVLFGVSRGISAFDPSSDRGRFRSWLSTIALRAIWRWRRSRLASPVKFVDPAFLDEFQAAQQSLLDEINSQVVELALAKISDEFDPQNWEAFIAVWSRGEAVRSVCDRLGRTATWVYKAKFDVLQRLNAAVQQISNDLASF